MMNIISKIICLSVFSLVCPTVTSASLTSAYASLVDTSQNQTFESEPQALGLVLPGQESSPIKLAAVHFITNDNALNFGNQEFLPGDLCKQGGYPHNGCPSGYIKGEACPYDSKYVKECIALDSWCKSNGYTVTSCSVPKYPANPCPYLSSLYKSCEVDNIRACKEAGYSLTCESGKIGNQSCPYNSSYKKCICNPCSGYDYTAAQASAQGYTPGEVCNSCGTIKYKRSENKCEGFKTCDCGSETGAKVCYSGSVKKYNSCKSCCDSKYKYDSSNCTGGKVPTGNSCGGKYDSCILSAKILYGDGTTSYDVIPGKTAIGIVINDGDGGYVRDGKTGRYIAMALTDVQKDGTSGSELMKWSTLKCDTALTNCLTRGNTWSVGCGDNGKTNTHSLIRETCGGIFEAAEAVYQFEPEGCSLNFCRRGNWFYPSDWEVQYLGGYATQVTLDKLQSHGYIIEPVDGKCYWTSSEGDTNRVTTLTVSNKYNNPKSYSEKDYSYGYYVRPLIEFK